MRTSHWLAALLFASATACSAGDLGPGGGSGGEGGEGGEGGGNLPDNDDPLGSSEGAVTFTSPERGAFIASAGATTVTVSGTAPTDDELTINGDTVAVDETGHFSIQLTPKPGFNVIDWELDSRPKVQGQRAFLFGEFAGADVFANAAVGLRINRDGMDDDDGEIDDMSAIAEAALADRNLMNQIPARYDAPAGIDAELTERSAGDPRVALSPRAGGIGARIELPNVRIRFRLSKGCAITTCHLTGTVTADAIVVTTNANLSLDGEELRAQSANANIDIVNLRHDTDGAAGAVFDGALDLFFPDLESRIEDALRPAVSNALSQDLGVALGSLGLPSTLELPQLGATYTLATRFDGVDFAEDGGHITAGAKVSAEFEATDPGAAAPGWFKVGMGSGGGFRVDPAFGVGASVDLVNQVLHATWGQGALRFEVPAGTINFAGPEIGAIHATFTAPPVIIPNANGELSLAVGDVMLETTIDGTPSLIALSVKSAVHLTIADDAASAQIELVGKPSLYAELVNGPEGLVGTLLTTFIESSAPTLIADKVGSIPVPLPTIPLDALGGGLAGRSLKIVAPAEVVTGEPAERVTLYGRLVAE